VIFGGIGAYIFLKAEVKTERQLVAFSGLTLLIFFLWSPGYSPQWVLFLLPLILLSLEGNQAILASLIAILVNLLEWPLLLSRGLFEYLPGTILFRSAVYVLIAIMLVGVVIENNHKNGLSE
jgi:hypothetical protein